MIAYRHKVSARLLSFHPVSLRLSHFDYLLLCLYNFQKWEMRKMKTLNSIRVKLCASSDGEEEVLVAYHDISIWKYAIYLNGEGFFGETSPREKWYRFIEKWLERYTSRADIMLCTLIFRERHSFSITLFKTILLFVSLRTVCICFVCVYAAVSPQSSRT